jgi:hypothetical protein
MLTEKIKKLFKEIYGADLDSEELFEEMYQKNCPRKPNRRSRYSKKDS